MHVLDLEDIKYMCSMPVTYILEGINLGCTCDSDIQSDLHGSCNVAVH